MAKVKAITSFAGIITMSAGQVGEIEDKAILKDLKSAGYVEVLDKEEQIIEDEQTSEKEQTVEDEQTSEEQQIVEKDEKKAKSSKKKGDA